jgi:formylglycine-generating enzyme required for sulfatase activity
MAFRLSLSLLLAGMVGSVAGHTAPPQRGPLSEADVVFLLKSDVSSERVRTLVARFGITFEASPRVLGLVKEAGGGDALVAAIRAAAPASVASAPASSPAPAPAAARRPGSSPASSLPIEPELALIPAGPRGDFYLGRYEVTNRQYQVYCTRMGRPLPEAPFWGRPDRFPVVNVTWHDAVSYCRWLSLETGRRYRLPTADEWEHAARAGLPPYSRYPWGDEDPLGRSCFGKGALCKVGSFKPNGYRLFDMAGSVAEWCQDGDRRGTKRFLKGGSWVSSPVQVEALTIPRRELAEPDKARNEIGLRVAMDP